MKKLLATTSLASLLLLAGGVGAQQAFKVTKLTAGMHVIKAEVAANDPERQQGLMMRETMEPNAGMVFVFDQPAKQCMWMKNTLLPLSVAFLDDKGAVINVEDMAPHTLESHCSSKPAKYALEMNKGWFKQRNIKPGMPIAGLPQLK
jgi:uncharacterized membrane protein (UPF0127 family)